ncbi:MAG: right-handed parallel beta-helix repeat-containing protein, partial [Candidatus Cloacimonetes bacterium]|nr:right-handed parallel beta-helix repeat-containing protein [Candidatus Cloacimonadota bacterium]
MRKAIFVYVLYFILNLTATIINIPTDQPTIQAGIDVAVEGDTVLVAPGTYYENISITQKDDIHIVGSGADVTTIDGGENGHVVWFDHSSGSIYNFTVTNSGDNPGYSAGIFTSHSSVIVISNIIYNNCYGLAISSSSEAQIHENRIIDNTGFRTVAISASTADISYNLIAENSNSG